MIIKEAVLSSFTKGGRAELLRNVDDTDVEVFFAFYPFTIPQIDEVHGTSMVRAAWLMIDSNLYCIAIFRSKDACWVFTFPQLVPLTAAMTIKSAHDINRLQTAQSQWIIACLPIAEALEQKLAEL